MNNSKKSTKRIFIMIILLFSLMAVHILKIVTIDRDEIIIHSYNPRINNSDNSYKRGDIKDINGNVLAYSEKIYDEYSRFYNDGESSSHVLGYTEKGKTGIEALENFTLQEITNEAGQRISEIFSENEVKGNSVVLTIDKNLQQKATEILGENKGSIVVLEVETGRVLTMVSNENYNPEEISENWELLVEDENSPLLNRATNGAYPPGSVFKIVTATAGLRHFENIENYTYNCTGTTRFENKTISCINGKAHGEVNLEEAFAESCNGYFAHVAEEIGSANLIKVSEELGFNKEFTFELSASVSKVLLEETSTESELVETSIGQGRTTVNPLFMASLVSAIGNDGLQMQPYIVNNSENHKGEIIEANVPQALNRIFSTNEVNKLKEYMLEVVETGTGFNAKTNAVEFGGKTGTAENPNGSDHLWFVGLAPLSEPQYAIAVVFENPNANANASRAAKEMIETIFLSN